jgi:hypothetical protein
MKIEKSVVEKTIISDIPTLDPIAVYTEDLGPSRGKITITVFNESWSYFWSAMGDNTTIKRFFVKCSNHYLFGKLCGMSDSTEPDYDKLVDLLKRDVLSRRRDKCLTELDACKCWEIIGTLEVESLSPDMLYNDNDFSELVNLLDGCVFDVVTDLPSKPSRKFEYVCTILDVIKQVFREELKDATT